MTDAIVYDKVKPVANETFDKIKEWSLDEQRSFFYELGINLLYPDKNTRIKCWEGLLSAGRSI